MLVGTSGAISGICARAGLAQSLATLQQSARPNDSQCIRSVSLLIDHPLQRHIVADKHCRARHPGLLKRIPASLVLAMVAPPEFTTQSSEPAQGGKRGMTCTFVTIVLIGTKRTKYLIDSE